MLDIITIGTGTQDVFLRGQQFKVHSSIMFPSGKAFSFEAGAKIELDDIIFETGGGATNTAVSFARLGLKTAAHFSIGKDKAGEEIVHALKHEGVRCGLIVRHNKELSSRSFIFLGTKGERTVFVYRGSTLKQQDLLIKKLKARWLYISSLGGRLDVLEKIASYARQRNIKIAFNPGSQEIKLGLKKLFPILDITDILILNRSEASELTGVSYNLSKTIVRQACGLTPGIELVTDGKNGAYVVDENQFYQIGVYDWPLIDRLGAGDAFGAGFVGGIIKYGNITKALQYAAFNASSVVREIGAKKGIVRCFPKNPLKVEVKVI